MSTVTLTFTLPEEADDARMAQYGQRYFVVLCALDEWLRSQIKYGTAAPPALAALDEARRKLHEYCEDQDVSLDRG